MVRVHDALHGMEVLARHVVRIGHIACLVHEHHPLGLELVAVDYCLVEGLLGRAQPIESLVHGVGQVVCHGTVAAEQGRDAVRVLTEVA